MCSAIFARMFVMGTTCARPPAAAGRGGAAGAGEGSGAAAGAGLGAGAGAGGGAAALVGAADGAGAEAEPPSSITATTVLMGTLDPSGIRIFFRTPATEDWISVSILSVEIS